MQKPRFGSICAANKGFLGPSRFSYGHLVLSLRSVCSMCVLRIVRNSVRSGNEGEKPFTETVSVRSERNFSMLPMGSRQGIFPLFCRPH